MIVINYGGGTNSTALIVEAISRGIKIDLIVFADTGSEHPKTYNYLDFFHRWLERKGYRLNIVRWIRKVGENAGKFVALHESCEQLGTLPSAAFGHSGCTVKWKQQPIDDFLEAHADVALSLKHGNPVERWIGYDADEAWRAEKMHRKNPNPHMWKWKAPLVEWGMGRDECLDIITKAGLPLPGKSACWLCPSSKEPEIIRLAEEHPDLIKRALDIEAAANVTSVMGLGRRWSWASILDAHRRQLPLLNLRPTLIECGCYDGDD